MRKHQVSDGGGRAIRQRVGLACARGRRGVFVHKFKIHATQYLLSYRMADADKRELIMIGPHENYYRDLTTYLTTRQ